MFFGSRKKKSASDANTPEPVQSQLVQSESVQSEQITPQPAEQSSIAGELEDIGVPLETEQQTMTSQSSPAKAEQIAEVRSKLHEAYGKVVLAATSVPRYRNLPIGELNGLFLEPLLRDRIAGGSREDDDGRTTDGRV